MLHIDGTTETGELDGSASRAPYSIFDDVLQDWIVAGVPSWLLAWLILKSIEFARSIKSK